MNEKSAGQMLQQCEERLKSAESALSFVQGEHKSILSGLHEELRRLQRKCSDLQFSLTTSSEAAKETDELRVQLQALLRDNSLKESRICELEETLLVRTNRLEELEMQLKWKEVEWRNLAESHEARIEQLQKDKIRVPLSKSKALRQKLLQQVVQTPLVDPRYELKGPLPSDYRASVSSLPPIAAAAERPVSRTARSSSVTAEAAVLRGGDVVDLGSLRRRRRKSYSAPDEMLDSGLDMTEVEVPVLCPSSPRNKGQRDSKENVAVVGGGSRTRFT